ncbi:HDOD domain-containing protein [Pseudomonas psychrophila]|uniref:HDOD domain-containing protein n=1 Tax=Pseudomonas psychrophila TaxID=122355 RepID=UPI0003570A5C|nr:HDOD domain-containing protein [Pseudomonas psychrophila]EPJ94430.1 response regulator [Pseudomonas psychrophila]
MTVVDLSAVPTVLIAEADPWTQDLLKQVVLTVRCDAQLDVCGDGQQALAQLSKKDYGLVIADRDLPGVSGLDLLRTVRQRRAVPAQPFILLSARNDSASVREALPLAPTAYLTTPLDIAGLTRRLKGLLLTAGQEISCEVPALVPGMTLKRFLEQHRASSDGAPLLVDAHSALNSSLTPEGLDLALLEQAVRTDPQITAVMIAAANSAAQHRIDPAQTLAQALQLLGPAQSMNLVLGLTLKRSAQLTDPCLADYAEQQWAVSLRTAQYGFELAGMLNLDQERCYCAGLLHRLGDLALLRSLEAWQQAGGELDTLAIDASLSEFGAAYGSALRTRWRLPLELRELIAAIYHLGGGVYSREALVMSLAAQVANLESEEGIAEVAGGKTARLLRVGMSQLLQLIDKP